MPEASPTLSSDREFIPWLQQQQISLAFTTYQTGWLALLGVNPETGQISAFQRQFDRAMGLYCTSERLYLSSKYQLWQLDNALASGQVYQGYDKLYIPRIGYTTGDLDIHDVFVDDAGKPIFISTLLNCLATTSDRHNCKPLWKPPFISQIINEDRCHLNGLAVENGKPRYVTACSRSDVVDGWRDRRRDGGVVVDIESNEIILSGLSMPHSPRLYRDKLWMLNSGAGEFGYVDVAAGKFEPVTFCPGYARGLAFWENYAVIGLSKSRAGDGTFSGLLLDERLEQKDAAARCGLLVVDLNTGATVHWVRIEGLIAELYDVGVLPGVQRPMALGFQTQEIEHLITLEVPLEATQEAPSASASKIAASESNLPSVSAASPEATEKKAPAVSQGLPAQPEEKARNLPGREPRLNDGKKAIANSKLQNEPLAKTQRSFALHLPGELTQQPRWLGMLLVWMLYREPREIPPQWYKWIVAASRFAGEFTQKSPISASRSTVEGSSYNSQFLLNRAFQLHQQQQFEAAIAFYQQVLALEPDNLLALTNIGKVFQHLNRHQEAIPPLRRALQLNPAAPQLHFYLSQSLKFQGDIETARQCLREAIRLQPDFWGAYNNLGAILQAENRLEEAAECYQKALQYNPNFADAHSNLASIWQLQGELERAKAGFIRALELQPRYVPALLNLAYIYKQQGRLPAAIDCYQQVIALEPRAEAYYNLGEILEYQGNIESAIACYEKVQQLGGENYGIDGYINYARLKVCDWKDGELRTQETLDSIRQYLNNETAYSLSPLALNAFPLSLELHREMAVHQAANISQKMAPVKARCNFQYPTAATDKLRIGYISPDFREHAVGKIVRDMFECHDRAAFEVYGYGTVDYNDAITDKIRTGCDRFINIAAMTAEEAARKINADGIHILIDLAGRTIGNAIEALALQPAPIQAQFLGYPDTMGAEFIQYAIADSWLITPEIAASYTEKIVYLPHAFFSSPMEISSRIPARSEFGLPDEAFVFCCFNSHYKINPEVFDVWMRILQQVPNSVLWLTRGSETLMANLRREARQRGVEENRLIFSEKIALPEYLSRYRLADLFLDTFTYNGGSTVISALWAGCPVLTRPGNTNASRMGASICAAAELDALICGSSEEYEKQAIYLATHPKALAYRRRHLAKNHDKLPLFDVSGFVRTLEAALWQMWENYLTPTL